MQNSAIQWARFKGASGAVSQAFAPNAQVNIHQIKFTLAANGASGDVLTANIGSALDAAYNGSLINQDMTGSKTSLNIYDPPFLLPNGDQITIAYPNTVNTEWGIEIAYSGAF